MIKNYCFLFFILFSFECISQNLLNWVSVQGGASEDINSSIDVDLYGQVYAVGYFRDTFNNMVSNGESDVAVCKYSPGGDLVWSVKLGGVAEDIANSLKLDQNGSLYITGHFRNTLFFSSDSVISQGNTDVFVAKIDTSGQILWLKTCTL